MRVLLISEDTAFRWFTGQGLREMGMAVDEAARGVDGFFHASTTGYDAIILDWTLPDIAGVTLLEFLRSNEVSTPVLTISATNHPSEDAVTALGAGGDDHLSKPVVVAELAARLRAISRRGPVISEVDVLTVGDLELNQRTRQVFRERKRILLQPRCFELLSHLMMHENEVVTRTALLEKVWEYHFDPRTSVVETHMSRLRRKIDRPFDRKLIRTVRGVGYMIAAA